MIVTDRSTNPSEFWPGLRAIFGEYERLPAIYKSFMATESSEKAFEELMSERAGLGLAVQQPELAPVSFDIGSEGIRQQVTHAGYGLAVAISHEAKEDNLYEDIAARMVRELNYSARQTEEYLAHSPLQVAFDATYGVRADGVPLISAAHPTPAGLQDNTLVAQDVSELAFEDMIVRISYMRNPRGFLINTILERLIMSPESGPEARRILGSPLQPNAQTNNVNVLRATGAIPEIVETPYLIDKDNWFAQTNIQNKGNGQGLTFWERTDYRVREDSNWSNMASLIAMYFRCSVSCVDFRAILGSAGADGV
jgi:hypothetical protein